MAARPRAALLARLEGLGGVAGFHAPLSTWSIVLASQPTASPPTCASIGGSFFSRTHLQTVNLLTA
jgi:hypothetical protein